MAERYTGSVGCVIPLSYKCSRCGATATSVIPMSESYSGIYNILAGSRQSQINNARQSAACRLKDTVSKIYQDEPLKSSRIITGECRSCKHREVWQASQKNYSFQIILGGIIGFLIVIACIVIPVILNSIVLIPVFMIGALVLVYTYSKISSILKEKIPSRQRKIKQNVIKKIPVANKPVYVLSCEQMLAKIKSELVHCVECPSKRNLHHRQQPHVRYDR